MSDSSPRRKCSSTLTTDMLLTHSSACPLLKCHIMFVSSILLFHIFSFISRSHLRKETELNRKEANENDISILLEVDMLMQLSKASQSVI